MTDNRHALPVGHEIEGYRIEGILGFGGFGVTYLAVDLALSRRVAIKEYLPAGTAVRVTADMSVAPAGESELNDYNWGLARFREEAATLVNFHHPNIVSVHRFFEANRTAYLVMQFVEGQNLDQILTRARSMPEQDIVRFLMPILDGLEEVHRAGFLHQDVKPANIYIRTDGTPILLDFSAARRARKNEEVTAIVSDGYAPYEQYGAGGQLGPWTDIYGLGAVLYRCVTAQRPHQAPDRIAALEQKQNDPLVPAVTAGQGRYSEALLMAIDAAMMPREKDRPQNVAALRRILGVELAQPKNFSREAREISRRVLHSDDDGEAAGGIAVRKVRRNPVVAIAAVVVLLIAVAGMGFLLGVRGVAGSGNTGIPSRELGKVADGAKPVLPRAALPSPPAIPEGQHDSAKPLPDVKTDKPHGAASTDNFTDCDTCPEMIRVKVQSAVLGSPEGESERDGDEPAQHAVKVQSAFALGRYEVTRAQFARFAKATGHRSEDGCFVWSVGRWTRSHARNWRDPGFSQSDDDPVVCVSAKDAEDYAAWLSDIAKRKYRLPTEREWEVAARAGSKESRYWGDDPREGCRHGNGADESGRTRHADWVGAGCDDGFAFTAPVGQFRPNALGLFDMMGNAAEWTSDCWRGYPAQSAGAADAAAAGVRDCNRRVVRGGAFNSSPRYLRSASRLKSSPNARIYNLGFRVARDLD